MFAIGLILSHILLKFDCNKVLVCNDSVAKKIITLNPAAAETIYALGAEEKLLAVSNYCVYPKQARQKPQVGDSISPDFEKLKNLKPDLIITMGSSEKLTDFCERNGIENLRLDMYDANEMFDDIIVLAKKLGLEQRGHSLVASIKRELEHVKKSVENLDRPKVFLSFFRMGNSLEGLSTAAGGTHLNNLIEIAGGRNIFGDLKYSYPKISKESLLKLGPDIIIEPRSHANLTREKIEDYKSHWRTLPHLPAVKNNRIYFPNENLILKPGPRLGKAAKILAEMIHPEIAE